MRSRRCSSAYPGAALVRANGAEATALTGERDPDRAADALARAGGGLVVLTLGADGVVVRASSGRGFGGRVQAVPVRSTIGAGDAFTGTLLAAVGGDRGNDVEAARPGRAARGDRGRGARV